MSLPTLAAVVSMFDDGAPGPFSSVEVADFWDGKVSPMPRLALAPDPMAPGFCLGPGDSREHTFPWRHRREPVVITFTRDERLIAECDTPEALEAFGKWYDGRQRYRRRYKRGAK